MPTFFQEKQKEKNGLLPLSYIIFILSSPMWYQNNEYRLLLLNKKLCKNLW